MSCSEDEAGGPQAVADTETGGGGPKGRAASHLKPLQKPFRDFLLVKDGNLMALTDQKRRYAAYRLTGMPKTKAAVAAGCPEKTAKQAACRYERDPDVLALMGGALPVEEAHKYRLEPKPAENPPQEVELPPCEDPIEFFKMVANNPGISISGRLAAAKEWALYTCSKPAAAGKKSEQEDAAKQAAKGKFKAAPAPLRAVK